MKYNVCKEWSAVVFLLLLFVFCHFFDFGLLTRQLVSTNNGMVDFFLSTYLLINWQNLLIHKLYICN